MTNEREEKIKLLRELERRGIVREEMPMVNYDTLQTAYWRFHVFNPVALPESLQDEYHRLGELRW